MASPWQIECLTYRINSLVAEIQRVSKKDHPYNEPRVVYEALLSVLDGRAKLLKDYVQLFQLPGGERSLQNCYETVARDVAIVAEVFSLVDRVDSARIPFEILRPLSWAARELVRGKYRVVVRLDPIFDYTFMSTRMVFENRGWGADWLKVTQKHKIAHDVLLLGIPSAYAHAILLNALAAHELGHLLFNTQRQQLKDIITLVFRQVFQKHNLKLQDYVARRARGLPGGLTQDAYANESADVYRLALSITMEWCSELYSDLVATRLLGPAYIAAFDRVLIGRWQPTESHPPNDLRRNLMITYFEKNFPQIVANSGELWASLKNGLSESARYVDELWTFGEEVCRSAVAPFTETLTKIVNTPFSEPPEEFSSLISEMQDHIDNLSPPSAVLGEKSMWINSNGFWSMFYAAWYFRLNRARFESFTRRYQWQDSPSDAEDALSNLLLQGLRSLELKFRFKAQKTGMRE
jgi:hypothetical protein